MLHGNDLFPAQEREGDHIRKDRSIPEPEFPRSVLRYVTIYEWTHDVGGERWPGVILYETYDAAANTGDPSLHIAVAAVRPVRIEL